MEFFTSDVRKYNVLSSGDGFGLRLQAYFSENNCHYMMIIYTVITQGEMFRKYGYADFTRK